MCRRRSSSLPTGCQPEADSRKQGNNPLREEVVRVKYFKITKTWSVKAESETEAIKLVVAEPEKYLDSETVLRTEYKRPQQQTGWVNAAKEQLLGGTNSKR
jgi:hypothetical protein